MLMMRRWNALVSLLGISVRLSDHLAIPVRQKSTSRGVFSVGDTTQNKTEQDRRRISLSHSPWRHVVMIWDLFSFTRQDSWKKKLLCFLVCKIQPDIGLEDWRVTPSAKMILILIAAAAAAAEDEIVPRTAWTYGCNFVEWGWGHKFQTVTGKRIRWWGCESTVYMLLFANCSPSWHTQIPV